MLFYVSLTIACIIAALLILYLYNALADAGKEVYKALLPSSKNHRASRPLNAKLNSNGNSATTPWGWKGNDSGVREHGSNSATGLDAILNNNASESASVGWPYREEKTELAGRANKVSRKAGSAKTGRRSGGKPWGW